MKIIYALLLLCICVSAEAVDVTVGGVGDGVTDDTAAVQASLTDCSANSKTCVIGAGKNHIAPITIVDNVAPSTQYYAPAVVTNQMTEMPRPRPFTSSR